MAFPGNERPRSPAILQAAKREAKPPEIWPAPSDGWPANRAVNLNRTPHPGRARTTRPARSRYADAPGPYRAPHLPPLRAQPRATRSKLTKPMIHLAPELECALRF